MSRLFSSALDDRRGSSGAPAIAPGFRDASPTRKVTHVALVAATSLWLAAAALPSARAEVVLGNLGPNGTGSLAATNFGLARTQASNAFIIKNYAMGFKTSNDTTEWILHRNLASVTLGLANNVVTGTITNFRVGIFADVGGQPSSTPVFTSAATPVSGQTPALYTFVFATQEGEAVLSRNTAYWVAPIVTVPPSAGEYRWFRNTAETNPVAYNDSGFTYTKTMQQLGNNAWQNNTFSGVNRSYSMSIAVIPIPESGTLPLAGIGLVVGGWAVKRNRKRRGGAVSDHGDDHAVEVGPALA